MNLAKISDDNQRVKGEKTFWDQAIMNPQQNGIITMVPWSPRANSIREGLPTKSSPLYTSKHPRRQNCHIYKHNWNQFLFFCDLDAL